MGRKAKVSKGPLDPCERDFSKVPNAAIHTCYSYEYMREVVRRSQPVQELLHSVLTSKCFGLNRAGDYWANLMGWFFGTAISFQPGCQFFPKVPWQGLSRKQQNDILAETQQRAVALGFAKDHQCLTLQVVPTDSLGSTMKLKDFASCEPLTVKSGGMAGPKQIEYGFFAIDWNFEDKRLLGKFKRWVEDQRAEAQMLGVKRTTILKPPVHKPKARGGYRDRLNWLGALRVVAHYRDRDLHDYADTNLKVDAPYSHTPDLYKNAKQATEWIDSVIRGWEETLRQYSEMGFYSQ